MKILSPEYLKIYELNEYPAFCCDSSFNIVSLNSAFAECNLPLNVGDSIRTAMQNIKDAATFLEASEKVSNGFPFFSTDFDIFRHKPIFILPIDFTEPDSSGYLCMLFFDSDSVLPSTNVAMPGLVDMYRSPIFDIINITQTLSRRFEEAEDYTGLGHLDHIMKSCYNMMRTTSSVQTYFKLVNGRYNFTKKKMLFRTHLNDISRTLLLLFTASKYKLTFKLCDEDVPLRFDSDMINLALFNVIANACLFSPVGSEVVITLALEDNCYSIIVRDEGDGIPAGNMERVFEPFFTYHSSPIREDQMGLGFGLPIAKKIIEEHNGSIFVKSAQNRGTDIAIRLPIPEPSDEPLTVHTNAAKYITNRLSSAQVIFADICDIKLG